MELKIGQHIKILSIKKIHYKIKTSLICRHRNAKPITQLQHAIQKIQYKVQSTLYCKIMRYSTYHSLFCYISIFFTRIPLYYRQAHWYLQLKSIRIISVIKPRNADYKSWATKNKHQTFEGTCRQGTWI